MTTPVLLAAPGLAVEPAVVQALGRPGVGVTVVRRCVDAVDLLGAADAGAARVAVIGPALPRLSRQTIDRLVEAQVVVIGIVDPTDGPGSAHLQALGVTPVIEAGEADPGSAARDLVQAVSRSAIVPAARPDPTPSAAHGMLTVVWGPAGAPGRTTVAVTLADESARMGAPTLLVDADTYGPAVASHLGLLDEASGLAVACRHADGGELDVHALAASARGLGGPGDLRVLTGIARAERWPDLRAAALTRVWSACRRLVPVTIVDVAAPLEADEEILSDTRAPRRHAATLTALAEADLVLAVGSADPVGMDRLIAALGDLRRWTEAPICVVVNRVRRGPLGRDPERQVREALARHAAVHDPVLVPDDRSALDACLRNGRTLAEAAPRSPARAPLRALATSLSAMPIAA